MEIPNGMRMSEKEARGGKDKSRLRLQFEKSVLTKAVWTQVKRAARRNAKGHWLYADVDRMLHVRALYERRVGGYWRLRE